ncbi:hypothetical protein [Haloarchaeobius sp. DT45]|uniref:hypothetical protein n=1 Tax=Haloarchaeobius sp. DT45 TaxID=3446116 RepID=UPI003F6C1130
MAVELQPVAQSAAAIVTATSAVYCGKVARSVAHRIDANEDRSQTNRGVLNGESDLVTEGVLDRLDRLESEVTD